MRTGATAAFSTFLAEIESAARVARRVGRLLKDSGLPFNETLERLNPDKMPEMARRMLPTLTSGDFVRRGDNLLLFGLPGRGKTAFGAALARTLIQGQQMMTHELAACRGLGMKVRPFQPELAAE